MTALMPKPQFSEDHDVNETALRLISWMVDNPYTPPNYGRPMTYEELIWRIQALHGTAAAREVMQAITWH